MQYAFISLLIDLMYNCILLYHARLPLRQSPVAREHISGLNSPWE